MTDKTPERIWAWEKQTQSRVSAITTELGVDRLWSAHGLPQIMNEIGAAEYVRADLHAAVVAERDQLEEAVNELLIVWQNDGSVGDLDLVKLHATIKSIETNRTELEKHHA